MQVCTTIVEIGKDLDYLLQRVISDSFTAFLLMYLGPVRFDICIRIVYFDYILPIEGV
jgi:hypothetical protein